MTKSSSSNYRLVLKKTSLTSSYKTGAEEIVLLKCLVSLVHLRLQDCPNFHYYVDLTKKIKVLRKNRGGENFRNFLTMSLL